MKNNEELEGNKGWATQRAFPAEMAKSGGLLTVLGLTKAEQDLDLVRVRQRSHLVLATHCPNAAESREAPSRAGADLS